MLEQWDTYDSYFNRIENMVLVRGESIPDGFFHYYKWVSSDQLIKMTGKELITTRMQKFIEELQG